MIAVHGSSVVDGGAYRCHRAWLVGCPGAVAERAVLSLLEAVSKAGKIV